jgi:hypothetical protein
MLKSKPIQKSAEYLLPYIAEIGHLRILPCDLSVVKSIDGTSYTDQVDSKRLTVRFVAVGIPCGDQIAAAVTTWRAREVLCDSSCSPELMRDHCSKLRVECDCVPV